MTTLLVVQIALAALGLVRWEAGRAGATPGFTRIEAPAGSTPLTPERGEDLARAYAAQWDANAILVSVTMRIQLVEEFDSGELAELPEDGYLVYVFATPDRTLSLLIDRKTGVYVSNAETAFGAPDWPSLDLTTYPKSSITATTTSTIIAGNAYRSTCPAIRTSAIVTASTFAGESGDPAPAWTVTFSDRRDPGSFDVLIRMDATSGTVITNDVRQRDCESE